MDSECTEGVINEDNRWLMKSETVITIDINKKPKKSSIWTLIFLIITIVITIIVGCLVIYKLVQAEKVDLVTSGEIKHNNW